MKYKRSYEVYPAQSENKVFLDFRNNLLRHEKWEASEIENNNYYMIYTWEIIWSTHI